MELVKINNGKLEVAQEVINQIVEFEKVKTDFEEKQKEVKETILKAMEEYDIKQFKNDLITITYVAPTTRVSVDSKKLQEEHEDIYLECLKESQVKSSLRIKVS